MTPDGLAQAVLGNSLVQHYPWLKELVILELAQRSRTTPSGIEAPTGCLLTDLGECLIHMQSIISDLAVSIIHNPNVEAYLKKTIEEAKSSRGQDHSDTEFIDSLVQKEQSLKYEALGSLTLMVQLTSYVVQSTATWHKPLKE